MKKIIGREQEVSILKRILTSKNPEFVAIYGRRRVGKTFLVREFFNNSPCLFFQITGLKNGSMADQIDHFTQEISRLFYSGIPLQNPKNWRDAFQLLTRSLSMASPSKKIILFFDEFPWLATPNSKLLQNLDYFWNRYWSQNPRVKLIICGSSASWIIEKIINNRGGLHNRLTQRILLNPFNLPETKKFLSHQGIKFSESHLLQIFMCVGGIPYYLTKIEKGLSAAQNIDQLAFQHQSFLLTEFDNLFASLFDHYDDYLKMIRLISNHRYGISQENLLKQLDKSLHGQTGLKMLRNLEDSGFTLSLKSLFHKKRGIYHRCIDEYTQFYLDWIEPTKETLALRGICSGYWEEQQKKQSWTIWAGYTFETICYKHLTQIRTALKLSPTALPDTWRYVPRSGSSEQGAQIDLLFDREDGAITLCEIKHTKTPYIIDKEEAKRLQQKIDVFKKKTKTKKEIFLAIISVNGLKETIYSEEIVSGLVTLKDFFDK